MFKLYITVKNLKKKNQYDKKLIKLKKLKFLKQIKIKQKKNIYTVLKSPHVNKKSREQFIFKKYIQKICLNFNNFFNLINFLFIFKKNFDKNSLLKFKIYEYKCL